MKKENLDYDPKKTFASIDLETEIDFDEEGEEIEGETYNLVEKLQVQEEFRGKGLGRKLLEEAIDAIDNDFRVILSADADEDVISREDLVEFYESMGFYVDAIDGMQGVRMVLDSNSDLIKKA